MIVKVKDLSSIQIYISQVQNCEDALNRAEFELKFNGYQAIKFRQDGLFPGEKETFTALKQAIRFYRKSLVDALKELNLPIEESDNDAEQ